MTTTNNHLTLIDQVGGIEKAKQLDEMLQKPGISEEWKISIINGMWHRSSVGFTHKDLRTAIAQYDTNHCQHGYDLACLICGFGTENGARVWRKQLELDHITDIRNHISPRTVVWDLASGEDWSVNHG